MYTVSCAKTIIYSELSEKVTKVCDEHKHNTLFFLCEC